LDEIEMEINDVQMYSDGSDCESEVSYPQSICVETLQDRHERDDYSAK